MTSESPSGPNHQGSAHDYLVILKTDVRGKMLGGRCINL